MAATTFRQNVRAGLYQLGVAWLAEGSNSQLVREVKDHRPPVFDPPILFVGNFVETINHSGQVRQRSFDAELVLVRATYDNAETMRLTDVAADSLEDYLSAHWHGLTANTLQEPVASADGAINDGSGVPFLATTFTVRAIIQEGRP